MATVLLVDDDEGIRGTVSDWLSTAGFDVLTASDAAIGFDQLVAHPEIDICITDLVMASFVLDGRGLLHAIGSIRPDIPVVLMTGYLSAAERLGDTKTTLLYKPVALDVLLAEINRLLST
jgi:DNA-binding NtrC family response regulator